MPRDNFDRPRRWQTSGRGPSKPPVSSLCLAYRLPRLQGTERPGRLSVAVVQKHERDDGPRSIQPDVVHPVVLELGAAVGNARGAQVSPVGAVVEGHAVQMRRADDGLVDVPVWRVCQDGKVGEPAEGAPRKDGNKLDTDCENIQCEIPRVGQGVFLPELRKSSLQPRNIGSIVQIIPLETDVQETT